MVSLSLHIPPISPFYYTSVVPVTFTQKIIYHFLSESSFLQLTALNNMTEQESKDTWLVSFKVRDLLCSRHELKYISIAAMFVFRRYVFIKILNDLTILNLCKKVISTSFRFEAWLLATVVTNYIPKGLVNNNTRFDWNGTIFLWGRWL